MKNLMMSLAGEHGWVLDYEDAPLQAESAFHDIAIPRWHQEHPGKNYLALKSRKFQVETSVPVNDSMAEAPDLLKRIVEQYNAGNNPDRFEVIQDGPQRFSLTVNAVKDDSGNLIPQTPALNLPIQMDPSKQTQFDALSSLVNQLSAVVKRPVVVGIVPVNLLSNTQCVPPGGSHPARYDLASILDASPIKLVWAFDYDRNDDFFALNIMVVQHFIQNAQGNRVLTPLKSR